RSLRYVNFDRFAAYLAGRAERPRDTNFHRVVTPAPRHVPFKLAVDIPESFFDDEGVAVVIDFTTDQVSVDAVGVVDRQVAFQVGPLHLRATAFRVADDGDGAAHGVTIDGVLL